jgi:hypothetical protein
LSLRTSFYKVQFGLVCGAEINLSVHTSFPQSHSIKYRQGPVAVFFSGRILILRTSSSTVHLGLVCGTFERAYILATESFYKIQARTSRSFFWENFDSAYIIL